MNARENHSEAAAGLFEDLPDVNQRQADEVRQARMAARHWPTNGYKPTPQAMWCVDADAGLTHSANFRMTLPTGRAASICAKQFWIRRVCRASAELSNAGQSGAGAHKA